ncbi:MAG: T9SS C-terminal target domain-containing protein [Flavobacteriales bacterium]|nr:T9SS C-terminal target domain-containing protein [Flavobacteriales bacterium]MBP9079993.1 T9SS C-terminal target domain-containing protein [Flavobacteriales bacterium]
MRTFLLLSALIPSLPALAQFPPPAGQPGTTAMHADSSAFVAWATGCSVQRGPMDISDAAAGQASVGEAAAAQGPATGTGVVSLGDGGSATLTFAVPLTNGPGWDLAVFENGTNTFLELAFVEVSSNGSDFFRFPATSNTQADQQVGPFSELDATLLDNLAGKYRAQYGTPFNLEDLADQPGLDVDFVTHVRVVDVVGCIQDPYATYDHLGNKVNDPWSTPFASSGFDLDGVGVIHQQVGTGIVVPAGPGVEAALFPNPAAGAAEIKFVLPMAGPVQIAITDAMGRNVLPVQEVLLPAGAHQRCLDLSKVRPGAYLLSILSIAGRACLKISVE